MDSLQMVCVNMVDVADNYMEWWQGRFNGLV
jgi:hypothetical protein